MKNYYILVLAAALAFSMAACKDNSTVNGPSTTTNVSNPISKDTLSGNIRGTMLAGKTYFIKDSIRVLRGDTLDIQSGVTVYMLNNPTIFILGTMITEGTQAAQVYLTVLPPLQTGVSAKGSWGGILCDSCNLLSIHWTHIDYTGGPDVQGSPRQAIRFNAGFGNSGVLDLEDSWVTYAADDGLKVYGGTGKILRNTLVSIGTTDGEAINMKLGWKGDVAYNVVWEPAGSCIKVETSTTILTSITKINVYNNTCVASGFRRLSEFGYGVLVDAGAQANVWNNLIVNDRYGLFIGTDADTANVRYGNNMFFGTIDTLNRAAEYYPTGDWAHLQATDKIGLDPQFVKFDGSASSVVAPSDQNDYHLKSTSPALGAGNVSFQTTGKGDKDIGAYTSTSTTNLH